MNNNPIGVIDSGVGGFSTCLEIKKLLPSESILSYADLLYMPYGQKTQDFLLQRVKQICTYLEKIGCKAIIIACNTASTIFINYPQEFSHIKIPILDVITSTLNTLSHQKIQVSLFTVISTQATMNSKIYPQLLKQKFPNIQVEQIAAIEWASLVETVDIESEEMEQGINKYLPIIKNQSDNLVILACTHFYYLEEKLKQHIPLVQFMNTSTPIVKDLIQILNAQKLLASQNPQYKVLCSQMSNTLMIKAQETFGSKITIEISEAIC